MGKNKTKKLYFLNFKERRCSEFNLKMSNQQFYLLALFAIYHKTKTRF